MFASSDTNTGLNFLFFPVVWFGVIFIRHGLYQDGVFKFTVYIPDNYPDGDCPVSRGQFGFIWWSVRRAYRA